MTIQQLIDALQALPDKERIVKVYDNDEILTDNRGIHYITGIDHERYGMSIFLDVSSSATLGGY